MKNYWLEKIESNNGPKMWSLEIPDVLQESYITINKLINSLSIINVTLHNIREDYELWKMVIELNEIITCNGLLKLYNDNGEISKFYIIHDLKVKSIDFPRYDGCFCDMTLRLEYSFME